MCGINGIVLNTNRNSFPDLPSMIHKMNETIVHRGPDSEGFFIKDKSIALGIRRLSIIDLSGGNQPIYNDEKTICIVFNGEIYNYLELKNSLQLKNISFKTKSDTEVILKLYELYGKECVSYLNGMFVFAIYDSVHNTMFIARDRIGEKPLYYYYNSNIYIFASELKSIISVLNFKPKISKKALNVFFTLSFIPSPYSIYDEIFKLEPGHFLNINCFSLQFEKIKYWDIASHVKIFDNSYNDTKILLRNLLYDSVKLRMVSDVPIGCFLSGGVDSSIITAIMTQLSSSKISTFTIAHKNKYFNESSKAELVAKHLGTDHHCIFFEHSDIMDDLNKLILNYDEPFADSSALPTYFVSKMAHKTITVALTGDGGDEIFAGYNRYLINFYAKKYNKYIPDIIHKFILMPLVLRISETRDNRQSIRFKLSKIIDSLSNNEFENTYNMICLCFKAKERQFLFDNTLLFSDEYKNDIQYYYNHIDDTGWLMKAQYVDLKCSLEGDMLVKVDRASMLASLECRAPMLDHNVIEFCRCLPADFKLKNNSGKKILKDIFSPLLPKGILNAPKSGFGVPVGNWLRQDLKSELLHYVNKSFISKQNIFSYNYIANLVNEHLNSVRDHTFKVWAFYCFQKWYINVYQE